MRTLVPSAHRLLIAVMLLVMPSANASAACGESGVALQILGSSGPFGGGRASAGYIVWIDGVSRVMVDAGGGTFVRFHEAGARIPDLRLLALSHFHPDHAAEVPALLWPRGGSLLVAGPSGSPGFPLVDDFLDGLVGPAGVFRVLDPRVTLDTMTVDVAAAAPTEVLSEGRLRVRGIGVPHADVPAVGYRVDVGDASVAFSSDQNGSDPAFAEFASGVDVLVVHFMVPEQSTSDLHARPSVWGRMATDAGVGTLVLSHRPDDISEMLPDLRSRYDGPVVVADDLICVAVE